MHAVWSAGDLGNAADGVTSFAGIVTFGGPPPARRQEELLAALVARHRPAARAHVRRTPRAVFAQTGTDDATRNGVLFAAASRLDNRAEIAAACGLEAGLGEAEVIRSAFEARGGAGLAQLLGVFALAHWNESARALTLARDCMGFRPLFYHTGDGFVAFASHLSDLLALPDVPRELDERMLANFLALNHREKETTFYRGVVRVPSRSVVQITPGGVERHTYWSPPVGAPPPYARDEDYIERARELFDRAVTRTLRDTPRVAIELSGGFDSSAVAATAARLGLADIHCYTGVPPQGCRPARDGWYLDERSKVEALARMHPSLNVTFVTPRGAHPRQSDPARFFPDLPLAMRNLCNLGWFGQIDDRIAQDEHAVVLTGTMGNMTTSWDGRYSLSALLKQGRLMRMLTEARAIARVKAQSLPRVLAGEGVKPLMPPSVQRAVIRLRGTAPEDVSGHSLLNPDAIEDLDLRRQWRADGFDPTYSARGTSAQVRAHQIFDQLQLSRDVVGMRYQTAGFDTRDPYADRELVEFCLSIPETLYRRNGVARWFGRRLFADRLPRDIVDETRRGEQASNWFELLDARKPVIEDAVERLEASHLASRLIDLPRLKRLIGEWPKDMHEAEDRMKEYRLGLDRAVHVGQFIRWVEGGNA